MCECACRAAERVGGWVVERLLTSKEKKETPRKTERSNREIDTHAHTQILGSKNKQKEKEGLTFGFSGIFLPQPLYYKSNKKSSA